MNPQLAWRPTPAALARRLDPRAELTYPAAALPSYRPLEQVTEAGRGQAAWQRLVDALLGWELHREARMVAAVQHPDVRLGGRIVNAAPFGPVAVLAPCRVVALVDAPGSRGFSYGTLPGHPLVGEETFTAEIDEDGLVVLRIRSRSEPVGLARLAPPLARAGQRWVNRRYAAAARRIAAP